MAAGHNPFAGFVGARLGAAEILDAEDAEAEEQGRVHALAGLPPQRVSERYLLGYTRGRMRLFGLAGARAASRRDDSR